MPYVDIDPLAAPWHIEKELKKLPENVQFWLLAQFERNDEKEKEESEIIERLCVNTCRKISEIQAIFENGLEKELKKRLPQKLFPKIEEILELIEEVDGILASHL